MGVFAGGGKRSMNYPDEIAAENTNNNDENDDHSYENGENNNNNDNDGNLNDEK